MIDLDPDVLELLACPNCHSPFAVDPERAELVCTGPGCGLVFPVIEDRIPVLLVDEARRARNDRTRP